MFQSIIDQEIIVTEKRIPNAHLVRRDVRIKFFFK